VSDFTRVVKSNPDITSSCGTALFSDGEFLSTKMISTFQEESKGYANGVISAGEHPSDHSTISLTSIVQSTHVSWNLSA